MNQNSGDQPDLFSSGPATRPVDQTTGYNDIHARLCIREERATAQEPQSGITATTQVRSSDRKMQGDPWDHHQEGSCVRCVTLGSSCSNEPSHESLQSQGQSLELERRVLPDTQVAQMAQPQVSLAMSITCVTQPGRHIDQS